MFYFPQKMCAIFKPEFCAIFLFRHFYETFVQSYIQAQFSADRGTLYLFKYQPAEPLEFTPHLKYLSYTSKNVVVLTPSLLS